MNITVNIEKVKFQGDDHYNAFILDRHGKLLRSGGGDNVKEAIVDLSFELAGKGYRTISRRVFLLKYDAIELQSQLTKNEHTPKTS